jgi:hypothetical protein
MMGMSIDNAVNPVEFPGDPLFDPLGSPPSVDQADFKAAGFEHHLLKPIDIAAYLISNALK